MKQTVLFLMVSLFSFFLSAQPIMVKDIVDGSGSSFGNSPEKFCSFSDKLIFAVDDQVHGEELWISDGTEAGTYMLKDINPAGNSEPHNFFEYNGLLYFGANDGTNGVDLWQTDGTTEGTVTAVPLSPDEYWWEVKNFIVMDEQLYFTHAHKLYKTDGTAAGTEMVKDLQGAPSLFVIFNDKMYFHAGNSGAKGLWMSDGTADGTQFVKDLAPSSSSSWYRDPVVFNGKLFFTGGELNDTQVWESDGTAGGTHVFKNINNSRFYTVLGDKMIFAGGTKLYSTDGTSTGTQVILNFDDFGYQDFENNFTVMGDYVYFTAQLGGFGSGYGWEMFKTNGESGGTEVVKDIDEGSFGSNPRHFTKIHNIIYFAANDGDVGNELWMTDGTEGGTQLLADIFQGDVLSGSNPYHLSEINGNLFFVADDGVHGKELWVYDIISLVDDLRKNDDLVTVFPNPADEKIFIQFTSSELGQLSYTLIDNLGRVVRRGILYGGDSEIGIEDLADGLYHLSVFSERGFQVVTVVVNR